MYFSPSRLIYPIEISAPTTILAPLEPSRRACEISSIDKAVLSSRSNSPYSEATINKGNSNRLKIYSDLYWGWIPIILISATAAATIPTRIATYCEYGSSKSKCKSWLQSAHPEEYARLYLASEEEKAAQLSEQIDNLEIDAAATPTPSGIAVAATEQGDDEANLMKKHQTRGGKGQAKDISAKLEKELLKRAKAKIIIKVSERNKRKAITTVRGMEVFELDLKKVAKRFAGKYACGCSVVKNPNGWEEIALQGDLAWDLAEFIPTEYPAINPAQIEVSEK